MTDQPFNQFGWDLNFAMKNCIYAQFIGFSFILIH